MREGEIIGTVRIYNGMFQKARLCLNTRTQRYEFVLPRSREESPREFNTCIQATCEGKPFTLWPFPSNRTDGRGQPPMPFFGEGSAEVLAGGGLELQLLILGTVMICA